MIEFIRPLHGRTVHGSCRIGRPMPRIPKELRQVFGLLPSLNPPGKTAGMDDLKSMADMATAVQRVLNNQSAIMYSLRSILDVQEIHGAKLDAIMEAATVEAGPSPVATALESLAANMRQNTRTLEELPEKLAAMIADEIAVEIDAATFEPAAPEGHDPSGMPN